MQTLTAAHSDLLVCLYRLARADKPAGVARLVAVLERPAKEVATDLASLEQAGLVDAARVRLTLAGLCVAASQVASAARVRAARASSRVRRPSRLPQAA